MKNSRMKDSTTIIISAVGLAFVLASPAEAAKSSKNKRSATATHMVRHRQTAQAVSGPGVGYQGGVLRGPLYNGQDYLGDDPDPAIRSYLLKDLGGRYGGSY